MAQTQTDWPGWAGGGPGAGSLQGLYDFAVRQSAAYAVGTLIGAGMFFFGSGKIRALGAVIVLIPGVDILLGNGVIVVLEETGILTGTAVTSDQMWIGPGTVFYVR